jgi:hypothetical protein
MSVWEVASSCGMHLIVGLADPELDAADLCVYDLTLLGNLEPAPDGPVDVFVIREAPPWAGEG